MPVRKLPTFQGYTVDMRLQEFRKVEIGRLLEIVPFDSDRGRELLEAMREEGIISPWSIVIYVVDDEMCA